MDTPAASDSLPTAAPDADDLVTRPAQGRVERWLRKLLDLSLRNNLLNCSISGAKQLKLAWADVARLEDELSKSTPFRLKPAPQVQSNAASYDAEADTAAFIAAAESAFARRELLTAENEDDLHRRLQAIYSTARREMEESGANTLYVACGFLKWYRTGVESKAYYAPVLLVPVSLTRTSVKAGFTLRGSDEETRINLTLLEFLRTEFGISIPELEGELPKDDYGTDVPRVLELLRQAVAEQKGWEVQSVCTLGSFSFTKYLMWRDLADRRESMFRNAIVAQIAAENRTTFPDQGDFPDPKSLDAGVDAAKVFTPLSADSSQLSAVLAAARGKSFVLIGPPGTGKSQTIANMIAHCLGHGKTVLFVAEKAAALQVVHKRLKRIGLQDFCLELHSNKANKKDALAQFRAAAEAVQGKAAADGWSEDVSELVGLRTRLNRLPQTMHRPYADDGTLYGDICRTAQTQPLQLPLLQEEAVGMTRERLKELTDEVRELRRHFEAVQALPPETRLSLKTTEYSAAWERDLADALVQCRALSDEAEQGVQRLAVALGDAAPADAAALYPLLKDWTEQPDSAGTAFLPAQAARSLETVEQLVAHAEQCRALRAQFSLPYPDSALDAPDLNALLRDCRELSVSWFLRRWWGMRRIARALKGLALSTAKPDCLRDLTALVNLRDERARMAAVPSAALPATFCKGEALTPEDAAMARRHVEAAAALSPAALQLAESLAAAPPSAASAVGKAVTAIAAVCRRLQECEPQLSRLSGSAVGRLAEQLQGQGSAWADALLNARGLWHELCLWNREAAASAAKGCGKVAELMAAGTLPPQEAESAVLAYLAEQRLRKESEQNAVLKDFAPQVHESRMAEFGEKDSTLMRRTSEHIRALLTARAAKIAEFGQETSLLQRELSKQRAHMPLRRLLTSLPNITPLLKPCLLMSPLSVAQYLTTETAPFDVVIFDEASQIPVWDAIGVIARGKSAVIVGDPRQMPPTSFFSRSKSEEEEDDAVEADMESILDECRACGIPEMNLSWHYRSKSESLIAFSNVKYYEDKLVTFPAPVMQDKALTFHPTGGVYESGANKRVNREEARQLVAHVIATLKAEGFRYTEATSIGIVTFNSQQQALIEDMLEAERAKDETLEPYFAEDNPEAVFVKNLENVQGDERGVIYFSTTYGRDAQGKMSMNFGPLNLSGGERRLNVAVTRARYGMHVFTSMAPEDINLSRTNARGAADLHDFLDYARRGAAAYLASHAGAAERERLAAAVAAQLQELGWNCRASVGVSGYRIDLAVEHPEREGETLAGIMLDGAAYAASNTARDRDVLRPSVLTGLGWRLIHLWALDWWRHPQTVVDRLDAQLKAFIEMGPPTPPQLPELVGALSEPEEEPAAAEAPQRTAPSAPLVAEEYCEFRPAKPVSAFAEMKDSALCRLITEAVQAEGPVTESRLLACLNSLCPGGIRKPQGAARLGECVTNLIVKGELENNPERLADGSFRRVLTRPGQPLLLPRTKGTRDWSDIPNSEWQAGADAVREHLGCLAGCDDHLKGTATYFGITRLTKNMKEHIAALIAP